MADCALQKPKLYIGTLFSNLRYWYGFDLSSWTIDYWISTKILWFHTDVTLWNEERADYIPPLDETKTNSVEKNTEKKEETLYFESKSTK